MKETYSRLVNAKHKYNRAGLNKCIAISNTLSALNIVKTTSNPIRNMITHVDNLGDNITDLLDNCFISCQNLESINFKNVKRIGKNCFRGTTKLTDIDTLNSNLSVYSLDDYAFSGSGLTGIDLRLVGATYSQLSDYEDCKPTDFETGPYLGKGVFQNCKNLKDVSLCCSTEIGDSMFAGCTSLSSISFANHGSCVGSYAFDGCTGLKSIRFPQNFQSLSEGMFRNCTELTSLTFEDSSSAQSKMVAFGDYCLSGCTKLSTLTIPQSFNDVYMLNTHDFTGSSLLSIYFSGINKTTLDKFKNKKVTTGTVDIVTTVPSDGKYKYGTWYGGNDAVINGVILYAKQNGIPIIILETKESGCGLCNTFKSTVLTTQKWKDWMQSQPILFCMGQTGGTGISKTVEQIRWDIEISKTFYSYTWKNGQIVSTTYNYDKSMWIYDGGTSRSLPCFEFVWWNKGALTNTDLVRLKTPVSDVKKYCAVDLSRVKKDVDYVSQRISYYLSESNATNTIDQSAYPTKTTKTTNQVFNMGGIGKNVTVVSSEGTKYTWNESKQYLT